MAVTRSRESVQDDAEPSNFTGIGAPGWAAVFAIFAVAVLLVASI